MMAQEQEQEQEQCGINSSSNTKWTRASCTTGWRSVSAPRTSSGLDS